jgi:hypothetical protein
MIPNLPAGLTTQDIGRRTLKAGSENCEDIAIVFDRELLTK